MFNVDEIDYRMRSIFLSKKFGKRKTNSVWQISAHKLGLNFVGEIEQQNFMAKLCVSGSFFFSANKVW